MKVYELLASSDKLTRGAMARDASGKECSPYDEDAASWCLSGAAGKCHSTNFFEVYGIIQNRIIEMDESFLSNVYSDDREDETLWIVEEWGDQSTWEEIYSLVKELEI